MFIIQSEHPLRVLHMEHPASSPNEEQHRVCGLEISPRRKPAFRATDTGKNWCSKDPGFWFIALLSQVNGRAGLPRASPVTEQCLSFIGCLFKGG